VCEAIYDLGASLELVHAYSLMHDDLPCMDDAPLRRGHPTTHRVHGEAAAVAAGAALIPLAALQALVAGRVLGLGAAASGLAAELCRAAGAGGMVGGQALDLLAEGERLSATELDRLHRLKTGALLTAALRMGALAGGASETLLAALDSYGRAVGLAFQIADDVLDATATAEALGKHPSDHALGKSTYVSLYGLEEAQRRALAEVVRAHGALLEGGVDAPALHALADFVVNRPR
jgi:geranylgeranyl pyrophosphate synthase